MGLQMLDYESEGVKNLDEKTIKSAESILAKGDRVELIPVKDGVKVVRVRREEVKCGKKV